MDLKVRCRQAVLDLNRMEGWGLPSEALDALCGRILRFATLDATADELATIIRNYHGDGPQYEAMLQPDSPDGCRLWEAVRHSYVRLASCHVAAPEAEDVAQEAWEKAIAAIGSFGFRSRLAAWLRTIIVHRCKDWYRRNRRRLGNPALDDPDQGDGPPDDNDGEAPEEAVLCEERLLLLDTTLKRKLSPRDLQILRRTYELYVHGEDDDPDDWDDKRIAEEAGLAPSSIPQIRKRILKRLKEDPEFRSLVEELFGCSLTEDDDDDPPDPAG